MPRLGRGVSPEPPIVAKLLEPVRDIGLKVPSGYEVARERVPWLGHTAAMVAFGAWPLQILAIRSYDGPGGAHPAAATCF